MSEKNPRSEAVRIFAWSGAVALPLAYGLQAFEVLGPGMIYYVINLIGAIGLIVLSLRRKMPSVGFMSLVWTILSIIAIVRLAVGDPSTN